MDVFVVGGPRTGSTFVSRLVAKLLETRVVVEPQMAWKAGNFRTLSDEKYYDLESPADHMRRILAATKRRLGVTSIVEKSPANALRLQLVAAAFPEGRMIYTRRSAASTVLSNVKRHESGDALNLSIAVRKYLLGGQGMSDPSEVFIPLYRQVPVRDYASFIRYALKLHALKRQSSLPFGLKLDEFESRFNHDKPQDYYGEVDNVCNAVLQNFKATHSHYPLIEVDVQETEEPEDMLVNIASFLGVTANQEALAYAEAMYRQKRKS